MSLNTIKIEIREKRSYPKAAYSPEEVLSIIRDDEKDFIEFIFKMKEGRLSNVSSTLKLKQFKSAFIDYVINFAISLSGELAAIYIWEWIRDRAESARKKQAKSSFRIKVSYKGKEDAWTIEGEYIGEQLPYIIDYIERLTKKER